MIIITPKVIMKLSNTATLKPIAVCVKGNLDCCQNKKQYEIGNHMDYYEIKHTTYTLCMPIGTNQKSTDGTPKII